ncbi:MAG: glycerophosphodiester phosphodiesterase family protein [Gammaproteobacteria bacterium]|nr:glycerophosphodiester phosphodiesterase family protein [Gammaproteobacteria bacterium]
MNIPRPAALATLAAATVFSAAQADFDRRDTGAECDGEDACGENKHSSPGATGTGVQLGPRPLYLVEGMDEGKLKDRLMRCQDGPFHLTDFSIAHRGAPMQFPEHSDLSYRAGARMGAGIVECDVTFTKDGELVCRHSECDLHTTTNIVATPLNDQCTVPWSGPYQDPKPLCCTSDLTLHEYKFLEAKIDASDPAADTPEGYLGGTASWRTDLYTGRAQVLTFQESIALNRELGVKHSPELKGATHPKRLKTIFGSQAAYAQKLIDELKSASVKPKDTWVQSFSKEDIMYWIEHEPVFARQAVYLDSIAPTAKPVIPRLTLDELKQLKNQGVQIFAPPMWALLAVNEAGKVIPSKYAEDITTAGLDIITWTFERSDLRKGAAKGGWYYQFDPTGNAIRKDAHMYKALHVLAKKVKVLGVFSDWPATVTYYANCMGLE